MLKRLEAGGITPYRKKALAACEKWIHERLVQSDGLGAIFPPIINTIIAFRCLGYALDDPRLLAQIHELEKLELEDEETLHVQPCFSPVWDTALVMEALSDGGTPADDPAMLKAARWLLDKEVKKIGDWKKACPAAEPGGWYFEYANEWYPDTDDTAEVLTALSRAKFPGEADDLARQGVDRPRPGVAARDAEPGRRLGRVRQGLRQRGPDLHPLRRPQRDDRPELRGHHRPRARGAPRDRRAGRPSGGAPRRGVRREQAVPGRDLVRPLGLQLHLRLVPRAAGPAARRRGPARAAATRKPPRGSARTRTRTAAGASSRTPTTIPDQGPGPLDAFADGLGARDPLRDRRPRLRRGAPRGRVPARPPAL